MPLEPRKPIAALLLSLSAALMPLALRAQTPQASQALQEVSVSGRVVDASASAVRDAEVFADSSLTGRGFRVSTDASGTFLIRSLAPGSYTLHAEKEGARSVPTTILLPAQATQQVHLVLSEAAAVPEAGGDRIEFVDKPTFTVAGVTDWTAVGGHGSDATLRTSEALNRQALALEARDSAARVSKEGDRGDSLRAALAASPQAYGANRELGLYYMDKLQFAQAVPLLDAAARLSGGAAEDEYHLALALQRQGDVTSAQRHIRQALAKKDAGDFHRLAGELEEQLGNPLAAVQEEQRATQMDPSEVNYFTWGSELLRHRAIWQAAEVFANGVKAHPASVRVRTAWGAALFAGARYDEAAQKICEASGLDPSVREPYLFAGKIALASPQVPSCVAQTLQRFLALRPDDAEANYLSAMLLLRQGGKPEQAEPLLRKAVALDPKCSDGYLQLGIMSAARKDYAGAIAEYMKSLEGDPQKGEAHYRLAVAYDRTGQPEKAKAEYRLHEQMDAADAALVERERREVKQFSIVTSGSPGTP